MSVELEQLKWNDVGLIPTVVQSDLGGEVRMVAWCNREALEKTLATGKAHFFSRSRGALWMKGESSGNTLAVRSVWVDCDADTLIFLVDPAGPSCHTGEQTCFFRRLDQANPGDAKLALPALAQLAGTLSGRKQSSSDKSYTKKLFDGGIEKINEKIGEEAEELCRALSSECDERVASEAADLLYHSLVGLLARGIDPLKVIETLRTRFGTSGLEEKAARALPDEPPQREPGNR